MSIIAPTVSSGAAIPIPSNSALPAPIAIEAFNEFRKLHPYVTIDDARLSAEELQEAIGWAEREFDETTVAATKAQDRWNGLRALAALRGSERHLGDSQMTLDLLWTAV